MVDADGADCDLEMPHAQRVHQVGPERAPRFSAEPDHVPGGVIALQGREIHASNCPEQPGCLPLLLYCAARGDGRGAPLDRAAVDAECADHVEVEWQPGITIVP